MHACPVHVYLTDALADWAAACNHPHRQPQLGRYTTGAFER
jgi:hypothetical protein